MTRVSSILENRLSNSKHTKSVLSNMLVAPAPLPCEQFSSVVVVASDKDDGSDVEPEQPNLTKQLSKEAIEISLGSDLRELETVEKLHITKKVVMRQLLSLRSQRDRYLIRAANQKLVYSVVEENRSVHLWWLGFLCYGLRPLQLRILNEAGDEVIRILRPFAFTTRVTPCQLQRMEVYSPPGTLIGTIEQQWSPLKPLYAIKGKNGEELFLLRGPGYGLGIYRDIQFEICRPDGAPVGSTSKRWRGVVHALFRAPILDKFVVAFEKDLTTEQKALLLASTLLVDYMYYDT